MAFDSSELRSGFKCFLMLDGATLPAIKITVHKCAERKSDTFHADLSVTACAQAGLTLSALADRDFKSAQVTFEVGGQSTKMFDGAPDEIDIDLTEMTVSISGRDKSAALADKRQNKQHKNKKSSDVFDEVAQDGNLQATSTGTDGNVGKKYADDDVHLHLNKNLFESASDLAEREGYRWYVDGSQAYFEPKDSTGSFPIHYTPPTAEDYARGNVLKISVKRNLQAAKTVKHKGKSFHHKERKIYTAEKTADGGSGDTLEYEHHFHNHSQQQLEKVLESRCKDTIRHEYNLSITMPGDVSATPRMTLPLSGTGTSFDNDYEIDSIEFEMEWDGGFPMTISTKAPKKGRSVK